MGYGSGSQSFTSCPHDMKMKILAAGKKNENYSTRLSYYIDSKSKSKIASSSNLFKFTLFFFWFFLATYNIFSQKEQVDVSNIILVQETEYRKERYSFLKRAF